MSSVIHIENLSNPPDNTLSITEEKLMSKILYTTKATNVGGRDGRVETDDKRLAFDLTPSASKTGTNPEQLFAAEYSSCFGSAIDAVAKHKNVTLAKSTVEVDVTLHQDDEGGYFISAELNVTLEGVDDAVAKDLVEAAHHVCPYSKATRGNMEVTLTANGAAI